MIQEKKNTFDWSCYASGSLSRLKKVASNFKFCHREGNFSRRIERKIGTNSKNNIWTIRISGSFQTKRFTDNPFNSVPFHSPFQFAMNTDSNSIKSQFVGTEYQGEPFTVPTRSQLIYLVKLPAFTKKGCFREFTLKQCILSRETLTSFCTTGI